jgi:hypothetical protein
MKIAMAEEREKFILQFIKLMHLTRVLVREKTVHHDIFSFSTALNDD